jgi:serine/threonine-protein kinase
MADHDCISDRDLRAFLLGELPEALVDTIVQHLNSCRHCEERAGHWDDLSDPAIRALRQQDRTPAPDVTTPYTSLPPDAPQGLAGAAPADAPAPAASDTRADGSSRYCLEEEVGHGGMGVVYRGRDASLDRTLAVKVLQERHRGRPDLERRFLEEARITGQLQHPGIPPIHALGTFPDGRPFFSMKLIEGSSLAELLGQRSGPADDQPRFLAIFAQVCETLAYAHSRGIIHRDLKPANIMVGAFGEVQVMDWGLAKVLRKEGDGSREKEDTRVQATPPPLAPSSLSVSEAGAVMGTPAYMSPEQARGEVDRLDERCDVFGLGAILCVILTGQPPYLGPNASAARRQAEEADLAGAHARLEAAGADAELLRLAKCCLSAEREQRPCNASEVARALAAYQEGVRQRLQRAEQERTAAQVRAREERKRRKLTAALAGATVLVVALIGAGAWWYQREQAQRQLATVGPVTAAVEETGSLLDQGWQLWERDDDPASWGVVLQGARLALERAEGILQSGEPTEPLREQVEAMRARLDETEADQRLIAELDRIVQEQAETSARIVPVEKATPIDAPPPGAQRRSPHGNGSRGGAGRAVVILGKESREGLAAQNRIARRYAAIFREHGLDVLGPDGDRVAPRLRGHRLKERLLASLVEWYAHAAEGPERAQLQEVLNGADPDNRFVLNRLHEARKDKAKQLALVAEVRDADLPVVVVVELTRLLRDAGAVDAAIEVVERARLRRPDSFWLNFDLADCYSRREPPRLEEAVRYFTAAAALRPQSGLALGRLGAALHARGDTDGAMRCYRTAISRDPRDAINHYNLGKAWYDKKEYDAAIRAYRDAIDCDPDLTAARHNLGIAFYVKGDHDKAIRTFRDGLAVAPKDAGLHTVLGMVLEEKGETREALSCYRAAILLDSQFTPVYCRLGMALAAEGDLDGAIRHYQTAARLAPRDAVIHYNLGTLLHMNKDGEGALRELRAAVACDPKMPDAHNNLGAALQEKEDTEGAIRCFRAAVEADPHYAHAHYNWGCALYHAKAVEGAMGHWRTALECDGKHARAHYNLGFVWQNRGEMGKAIRCYRAAIAGDSKFAEPHNNLGAILQAQGHLDAAVRCYRDAIQIDPRYAAAHANLGAALGARGDLKGAADSIAAAITLDPKQAKYHNDWGVLQEKKGNLEEALRSFRKAINIDGQLVVAHINVGKVLRVKKDLPGAIRAFQTACQLDPKSFEAHLHLGMAQEARGDRDGAAAAFRTASQIEPRNAAAQFFLGNVLLAKGDLEAAASAYREVINIEPEVAEAHYSLGQVLLRLGQFRAALQSLERGDRLGSKRPDWRYPSARWVEEARRLLALDEKLTAIRKGNKKPADAAETFALAQLCAQYKRLYRTATRFYADAFAAEPKLMENPHRGHCYFAARAAVLAAAGQGKDADGLDDPERARLRDQALKWLSADLAGWTKEQAKGTPQSRNDVRLALSFWQQDRDLAVVRGEGSLARLPREERRAWAQLWADVDALLARVRDAR